VETVSAAARLLPWEEDYLLPLGTRTVGVLIRCGCYRAPHPRNIHVSEEAIIWVRQLPEPPPPDMVWLSWRCPGKCKQIVKVTARMLYFSA
jgi:hypothetical protein